MVDKGTMHVCECVRWEGENSSEWVTVPHPLNGD